MFKIPKRCEYCAHKLVDGKCVNQNCIAYQPADTTTDDTKKEESK